MKRSENACSLCRTRIISFFSITSAVVGVTAVAVPMRMGCPARQPSPKKSPGPKIATTASLPASFTTESRTPPFWMYNTSLAESPCEKIVSFFRNSVTFRATPAESRNTWGSKAGFCVGFVLGLILVEALIACITQALTYQPTISLRLVATSRDLRSVNRPPRRSGLRISGPTSLKARLGNDLQHIHDSAGFLLLLIRSNRRPYCLQAAHSTVLWQKEDCRLAQQTLGAPVRRDP